MRYVAMFAPLLTAFLSGCSCAAPLSTAPDGACQAQVAQFVPVSYQPAAAAAPCAAPQMVQAQVVGQPQMIAGGQQIVPVQYRVGATEWTKAGLAIPGNVVVCFGQFLRCSLESLFPAPTPAAYPVQYAPPVQYVAPVQAAPCAPPAGTWQFVPAAPAAPAPAAAPAGCGLLCPPRIETGEVAPAGMVAAR